MSLLLMRGMAVAQLAARLAWDYRYMAARGARRVAGIGRRGAALDGRCTLDPRRWSRALSAEALPEAELGFCL